MKKIGLVAILVLNITALLIAGSGIFKYFLKEKNLEAADSVEVAAEIKTEKEDTCANLNITSIPDEAKVFVNGYYKGKTPLELRVVSVEKNSNYKLVLMKQGYLRWENDIELYAGDIKDFQVVLKRKDEIY